MTLQVGYDPVQDGGKNDGLQSHVCVLHYLVMSCTVLHVLPPGTSTYVILFSHLFAAEHHSLITNIIGFRGVALC